MVTAKSQTHASPATISIGGRRKLGFRPGGPRDEEPDLFILSSIEVNNGAILVLYGRLLYFDGKIATGREGALMLAEPSRLLRRPSPSFFFHTL